MSVLLSAGAAFTSPVARADVPAQAILSLASDPTDPGMLYAGTRRWGLARSVDGGRTWSAAGRGLQGTAITAVAVHPEGQVIYVGTRTRGLFLSIDSGTTFKRVGRGLPDPEIRSVAIHPQEPHILFVGTAAGLARSDDAGLHFVPDAGTPPMDVHEIALSTVQRNGPRDESVLPFPIERHFETGSPFGLFMVGDGAVWGCNLDEPPRCEKLLDSQRSHALGGDALPREGGADLHLAVAPSEPNVLYVAAPFGLFRSVDRGHNWALFRTPHAARDLAVHPGRAHVLWLAHAGGIDRSVDGGVTFGTLSTPTLTGILVLIPHPTDGDGFFAAGTDGRVAALENGQVRVASLHGGQVRRHRQEVPADALPIDRLIARSEISSLAGPHANQTVDVLKVDPRFHDILYAGSRFGIFRSTDHGRSWRPRNSGLGAAPILDLVIESADSYADDPRNGARVIVSVAGRGLYRSVDSGAHWSPVKGIPDPVVRTLAQDPADTDLIVAGTRSQGIFYSTDGGVSWQASRRQPSIPGIRDVVITPLRLYAATDFGAVFESLDRGSTWSRLGLDDADVEPAAVGFEPRRTEAKRLRDYGLDSRALHINALATDSKTEGRLLAATGLGLFATNDQGASWRRLAPWHNVTDLAQSPTEPRHWIAAGAQGPLVSHDGGDTWSLVSFAEPAHAILFDPLAPSAAWVGDDRGTVQALDLDKPQHPATTGRLARPVAVPNLERISAQLRIAPRPTRAETDPFRIKRRRLLDAVVGPPGDLLLEDPRLSILILLETFQRYEEDELKFSLDEVAHRLLTNLKEMQQGYVERWGARQAALSPTGDTLAVSYAWDDGLASHSEIRLFDLNRLPLVRPDAMQSAGPSTLWKELHDVHRRPESPASRVLTGAGRFLAWSPSGRILISRPQSDRVQLWGIASGRLERTITGLPSPPQKASLSPRGNVLGIVGYDGRPVRVDTRSHTLYLPPASDSPVTAILARNDGLLTAQQDGVVTHWSLGDDGRRLFELDGAVAYDSASPDGRWWLLASRSPEASETAERRAYLIDLKAPEEVVFELGTGTWQEARFSPDGRHLLLRSAGSPSLMVDLRPADFDHPIEIFELGPTDTARFDPILPILVTGSESWSLDHRPSANDDKDRLLAKRLLHDDVRERNHFFRTFRAEDREPPPTSPRPDLGAGRHTVLDSPDGQRRLVFGRRGMVALERFETPRADHGAEPKAAVTVGLGLFSLHRHDTTGRSASPTDQWPLGLTKKSPWDPSAVDNVPAERRRETSADRPGPYLSLLLEWGCTLAGRNPSAEEWRRWFGDAPYEATCHFEEPSRGAQ